MAVTYQLPENLAEYQQALYDPQVPRQHLVEALWRYQYAENPVMREYVDRIGATAPCSVPIAFFKQFAMQSGHWEPQLTFESSGTTGQVPSRHLLRDRAWYEHNVLEGFRSHFGTGEYRILALLPSYLERGNSSLVYMVQTWMQAFGTAGSGFFLHDFEALRAAAEAGHRAGERLLLIGVTFALLDLVEERPLPLPPDSLVIETGGMKGRREEITREELHARLRTGLKVKQIHSEYGMTELLSQAYTVDGRRFRPAPSLLVRISDLHLDRLPAPTGRAGRIQLIDLANVDSCAFIATDDLGRIHPDGSFEVLGRIDNAELRGCNLMYLS